MSNQQDKMWSASMDGELSAAESVDYDQPLTESQKANLSAEMKLERGIAERLSAGAACPDEVWRRTLAAVEARAVPAQRKGLSPRWSYAITALAAVLALTVVGALYRTMQFQREPSILAMAPTETVQTLAARGTMRGAGTDEVNGFLKQHGFDVAMTTTNVQVPGAHHTREMLGVHPVSYRGEDVMELLFDCCGKPIKIVVAPVGSRTADEIGSAVAAGELQALKPVGGYVAAVVGQHKAEGLLEYVTEASA